jgi:hypothetical protein
VCGDDPGRLRLTTGGGSVSFNLCVLLLLTGVCVWRLRYVKGRTTEWPILPLVLVNIGIVSFVSSQLGDRYIRPGVFVAWEWIALAVAVYLTRRLATGASDARSVVNVIVASGVSIAGLACYQSLTAPLDLPSLDVSTPIVSAQLAGDDEFYPELNQSTSIAKPPKGTFDSPATLVLFLLLVLPIAVCSASAGLATKRGRFVLAAPILIAFGVLVALLARPFRDTTESWQATTDLLRSHLWLGIGPGNFSRMATSSTIVPAAWLDLAATIGIVGILLFSVAIAFAFWRAIAPTTESTTETQTTRRWEFHLGGAAGLVLGFVWSYGDVPAEAPPSEVFKLGTAAVFRAVIWFAAFALLETVRPSTRSLVRAILVGAALVVVMGLISEAPGRPTILVPMFVLLTLAVNLQSAANVTADWKWARPARTAMAIAAVILAIGYLVTACLPAWATASAMRQARTASRHFPERDREVDRARPGATRATALTNSRGFLLANILHPLRHAAERDPGNAALWLELARWRRPLWRYQLVADPEDAIRVADETRKSAEVAGMLDPHNLAAKRSLFEAFLFYRRESKTREPERIAALNKLIGQIAEKEPTSEVPMRYRVVVMLLDRHDAEGVQSEVSELLRLNRVEGSPHGSLTAEQRSEIVDRAIKIVPKAPKELLKEWTDP